MFFGGQQPSASGQFERRNAFVSRTTGDAEEIVAVGFREATVAVGDVGRNREAWRLS